MFDMAKHANKNGGYKLVINYNAKTKVFTVAGYTWSLDRNNITHSDQDGDFLVFNNIEDAIKSITEYQDK